MVPGLIERNLRAAEQRRPQLLADARSQQLRPAPPAGRPKTGARVRARGTFALIFARVTAVIANLRSGHERRAVHSAHFR